MLAYPTLSALSFPERHLATPIACYSCSLRAQRVLGGWLLALSSQTDMVGIGLNVMLYIAVLTASSSCARKLSRWIQGTLQALHDPVLKVETDKIARIKNRCLTILRFCPIDRSR